MGNDERRYDDDDDHNDRDAAILRAIAHAPPRRPPSSAVAGAPWGASGRYVIEQRLGRGGMGTVYAATDAVLNRLVALKVLDAGDADQAELVGEAQLAARVEHERIARVYDVGSHEGFAFVAMEYIPGGNLRQRMDHGEVPLAEIVDIVTQIAEGLAELHAKRVIHRDLKPENVMLTRSGGVKLVDFGLARNTVAHDPAALSPVRRGPPTYGSAITASTSGTPGYMAPEQCPGRPLDARVDVFALGVILHELVTREHPPAEASDGSWRSAMRAGDGAWARVPRALRDHAARMLAREPEARFEHGNSVLAALREVAAGMPDHRTGLPEATVQRPGQGATRRALPKLVRAAEITVAAAVALLVVWPPPPPPPLPPPPAEMVRIEGGRIAVGQDADELERLCRAMGAVCDRTYLEHEAPRDEITVAPFFLDREEVTNAEYVELLNTYNGTLNVFEDEEFHYPRFVRQNAGAGDALLVDLNAKHGGIEYVDRRFRARAGREDLPVVQVSWHAAKLYCEMRGKRLPTENEWEAAARGRDDRRFPWGHALPRCGQVAIGSDDWLPGRAPCPPGPAVEVAQPVGSMAQDVTPDGVRDLGGNVAEWTSSAFVEGSRRGTPAADADKAPRVIRGGSWYGSLMARTSARERVPPSVMAPNLGFRCASSMAGALP